MSFTALVLEVFSWLFSVKVNSSFFGLTDVVQADYDWADGVKERY